MTPLAGITAWEARQVEAHLRYLETERRQLREALTWAIDWIDFCREAPTTDEPDALEQYTTARDLLGGRAP